MSNKFNANALTEYSKSYARRVAADFYQQHTTINGQQILSLTPINQINLLVISTLSDKWQADAEKFRSPFFDFTNADVQEALQNFMNVVSQHISVRREHLEPLLADAIRRTITLIFDPRAYFDDVLRSQPEFTLTASALRQITRYTKINQFIPAHITQRMNGKPFIYVNQALTYLDEVLTQRGHEIEHYDKFVSLFSEKVPMDVSALLRSHVPDNIPPAPGRSFFDTITESAVPPAPLVPLTNNVAEDDQSKHEGAVSETTRPAIPPQPDPTPAPMDDSSASGPMFLGSSSGSGPEPVAPISQPSQLQTGSITQPTVNQTDNLTVPTEAAPTLNDKLRESNSAEPVTVAETFHRAPIESIARSISLNQKFRFINQLFNGSSAAYNQAIEEIDTLNNYGQALDLISYRYASQYLWDMSSDEVSELVEILKRRFS
ncbi:hypothetical protein GCM10028806_49980 [Spirosoma terrae]|uniref:Uncharacterized protein n=1 Tax=Spirosoma terrae TaxID=1968276 RepID=A0A6L9KZ72_9BACT|nr:hypothetical protein [Spirosoma terrae]NDU93340.1 hypothetical protein [Spirosoma terrae]